MSPRVQTETPSRSGSGPCRVNARNAACCPSVSHDGWRWDCRTARREPLGVVAHDRVAQRLTIHPRQPGRLGAGQTAERDDDRVGTRRGTRIRHRRVQAQRCRVHLRPDRQLVRHRRYQRETSHVHAASANPRGELGKTISNITPPDDALAIDLGQ